MEQHPHTVRLALMLALVVVLLVVVSIDHFVEQGDKNQQAAVLRAYAK